MKGSNQYRVIMSVFIIVSLFVVGGCSKQLSFDELIDAEMNDLSLYTHSSNSMNYEISILSKFELSDSGIEDTSKFDIFIDTSEGVCQAEPDTTREIANFGKRKSIAGLNWRR